MKRIIILTIALIACASQMFAQLQLFSVEKTGTEANPQYIQGDEITGTTINISAGVSTDYYFKIKIKHFQKCYL